MVGITDQVGGGQSSDLHVQGGDFENPYLVEEPVYEVPYLGVVKKITHQEIFMNPDLGEENMNPDLGEEIKNPDLGEVIKNPDLGR